MNNYKVINKKNGGNIHTVPQKPLEQQGQCGKSSLIGDPQPTNFNKFPNKY